MSLVSDPDLARAAAVRARGTALPPGDMPPPEILDSWVRCMRAGLDPAATMAIQVVEATELRERRERAEVVRRLVQGELETLAQQIAGSNFLLAFGDRDGVILDLYTDNRFAMNSGNAGIVAGSCWSEALCGTNGLGTALADGRSVAVTGLEHYVLKLGEISCTATPVRDALGEVVGVLDASSYFSARQRHTQALVQMAATHIENSLLAHQMRAHLVLALHARPEYLNTLSAGLLAFDEGGRLLAANARGRKLLQGLATAPGTRFEALFCEPFDALLARLQGPGELRLRDALGSSLVAACLSRPVAPRSQVVDGPSAGPAQRRMRAPADETVVLHDAAVIEAYRIAEAAVRLKVPLLIQGETGCGKEVLARHVHSASGRRGAFVPVNCAALPAELIEAELFGYVGGAFTGARREGSAGLIASADGGTLLLDEVGDLRPAMQAALLRFLDDQTVRAVGGTRSRRVDVQVLAASNVDLELAVAEHRFRADLLYRLNTVRVDLPPLRSRSDFADAARATLALLDPHATVDDAAIARLAQHRWPGNFRELRATLTRALLHGGGRLRLEDVERVLPVPTAMAATAGSALQINAAGLVRREFDRCGSVSQVARALGISRTTVYRHLRSPR